MFAEEHLALRLIHLDAGEEWVNPVTGLLFIFSKSGRGEFVAPAVTHHLFPGDVLVLNGNPGGRLRADSAGALECSLFSTHLEHLYPLFAGDEIAQLQNVAEGFKATRFYAAASPLAAECHRLLAEAPPRVNLDHRAQLMRVTAAVLGMELQANQPPRSGFVTAEEHMTRVFAKLSTDEFMNLAVHELAARFGCSKRHLSRLFQRHFGLSPGAMRMEMRLLKAVSLMREPTAKVINAAEQCGFNHLGLFSSCFKRRFGASPTQYRKMLARAEGQAAQPQHKVPVAPLESCEFSNAGARLPIAPPPTTTTAELPHPVTLKIVIRAKSSPSDGQTNGARPVRFGRNPDTVSCAS
jgi:AraC-like DNA-binding protein